MEQKQFDQLLTGLNEVKTVMQESEQWQLNMETELQKTNQRLFSLDEKVDENFLVLDKNFLNLDEKMNENFLNLEEKINMIHLQAVELSEQHQGILSQLKDTAKKDDVAYTEKKLLDHDREIFKIKKHLHMNS